MWEKIKDLYERFAGGPRHTFFYHTLPVGYIGILFSFIFSTFIISIPDGRNMSTGNKILVYIFIAVICFAVGAALGCLIDLFTFRREEKAPVTGWQTVEFNKETQTIEPLKYFICKRCGHYVLWDEMCYVKEIHGDFPGRHGRCSICGNPYDYKEISRDEYFKYLDLFI
ncbi:MAG: hypothetical protein IKI84_13365 [Clostridia bacterium]|nr:hypothetical protein [Clostridia bacterium]